MGWRPERKSRGSGGRLSGNRAEVFAKHFRGIIKPGDPILGQQGGKIPQGNLKKFRRTSPLEFTPENEVQDEGGLRLLARFIFRAEHL